MKLKVKFLKLSAGRPVAILNKKFSSNNNIHVDDRIFIRKNNEKVIAVVDVASGLLKENEIVVSEEIALELVLKENDLVEVYLTQKPESINLIYEKLLCKPLTKKEIKEIISDIVSNAITESEIAFFVSAIYKCGMSIKETESMISAIVETGKKLRLRGKIVDKHSIGGIPGRTTPIIVSIVSAAGLIIPKTSSRAITSPSGTADAMEVICRVDFSIPELKRILKKEKACLVWGGSLNLAPADDKIIQVERLLNLDPESQLIASIIAKKLAVDSKYVLIDLPYGKNTKLKTKTEALLLKSKFEKIAKHFHIHLKCSMKKIEEPLGNGIGPALEIKEVIKVLKREDSCYLLEKRALELSGELLELAGKAKKGKGVFLARKILDSGKAFKKFKSIIKAQKGKVDGIKEARFKRDIHSSKNFKISEIKIKELNNLARIAGCPQDKYAGIYLHKHLNSKVKKGKKLLTLYSETQEKLKEAISYYKKNKLII